MKHVVIMSLGAILLGSAPARLWADDIETAVSDKGLSDHGMMGEHRVEHRVEHLTQALKLTPDQQTQVKQILEDQANQMKSLHEQMKTIHQQSEDKITALLNDDQKKKYQTMREKRKATMQKRWTHRKEMKEMKQAPK